MSESNEVKFVEDNGKWLWKRYDADGSVTFRSPIFETEAQAREDYEMNGGQTGSSTVPENTEAGATDASAEANTSTSEGNSEQASV
jgi:hypothetical protein